MMTLEEWSKYIQTLAGAPLRSKAIACNTQQFADDMLEDGMGMDEVEEVILYFVRQLKAAGLKIPEGGAFDMNRMAVVDPVSRHTQPMPEGVANALEAAVLKKEEAEAAREEKDEA